MENKEEILYRVLTSNTDKVDNKGAVHTDVMLQAMTEYGNQQWNAALEKGIEEAETIYLEDDTVRAATVETLTNLKK